VAEEFLYVCDVHALVEEPCGHRVPKQVRVDAILDAGLPRDGTHNLTDEGVVDNPTLMQQLGLSPRRPDSE
jgi:hypothetical protein